MLSASAKKSIKLFLGQDLGKGDVTSAITPQANAQAIVKANQECLLAGIEEAKYLLESRGLKVKLHKKDGSKARKGKKILSMRGNNRRILEAERVCLNILGRMSGVATYCAQARKAAGNTKTRLAVTRKTVPGFQELDKKAAQVTGLWTHRKNLAEMVLFKENHLIFFESISHALKTAKKKTNKKIEIEVETPKQALEAARENPFMIMLDNFSPKKAKATIRLLRSKGFNGKIELSGGITLKNLRKYSNLGADIISMGEPTKKAEIIDFSMGVKKW